MTDLGPQQFELEVFDTYPTWNPVKPSTDLRVEARIGVTVNWDIPRRELTKEGVEFGEPLWVQGSSAPCPIYEEKIDGARIAVGAVSWKIATGVLKRIETDTPRGLYRWALTPYAKLYRTIEKPSGSTPLTTEAYLGSSTVRGNWMSAPKTENQPEG